jgi:ATP:ADP antiporter, AAA family
MSSKLRSMVGSLIHGDKYERRKLLLLSLTYFLVIGSYTLVRELKSAFFMTVVGIESLPWARLLAMVMLIPGVMFYSFLVDRLRRYQLLYFYAIVYAIAGIICLYMIGHPTIGILNTDASQHRLFWWFFYFFTEGFSPFIVSVFWAFVNSVYSPDGARENYAFLVSGSKLGGMAASGFAWILMSLRSSVGEPLLSTVAGHQLLLGIFTILVLLIPLVLHLFVKTVPNRYLHGYEAVYQFEKHKKEIGQEKTGIWAGLLMFIKWPYLFGIFGMLFFYEVISTILSYHRLGVAESISKNISEVSAFLFKTAFIQHLVGLLISFLGTRTLLERFGERICLLLTPIITGGLLVYFLFSYTESAIIVGLILLQALNYAFAQPVRESLYIPTVKEMKFKSKSWIDAFGSRFAKGAGSCFVLLARKAGHGLFFPVYSIFFSTLILAWTVTAYALGRRFARAVEQQEVIGLEPEEAVNA